MSYPLLAKRALALLTDQKGLEGNSSKQYVGKPQTKSPPQNMGTSSVALEHLHHYNKTT